MEDRQKEVEEYLQKKKDKANVMDGIMALFFIASFIAGIIVSIAIIIYKFKNPHLTETELFIYTVRNYWWLFIALFVDAVWINK